MNKNRLSRKEKEKLRHREEILETALSLFSSKGFHNVSMQGIASASEFGVGTLYNFFESKEQLFAELMEASIEKIGRQLIPILDSDKREDKKISEFIQTHVELIESNIEFIKLYISQHGDASVENMSAENKSVDLRKIVGKKIENIIKAGMQKQIFKPVCPEVVSLSLRATLETFGIESSKSFDKANIKEGFKKIEDFYMNCLMRKETDDD